MSHPIRARLAVGAGFALVAGSLAGFLYEKRDFVFEWSWARPHGSLNRAVPPELVASARDFAEARRRGQACVAQGVAFDDRYLYAVVGCGASEQPGKRDETPVPIRFRYRDKAVSSWEQPAAGAYENSFHRLFPREVADVTFGLARSAYQAALGARLQEKLGAHP